VNYDQKAIKGSTDGAKLKPALMMFLFFASIPSGAFGQDVQLRCKGTEFIYQDGFGRGNPLKTETVRLVRVDLTRKRMSSDTLHGQRTATASISERAFKATFQHDVDQIYGMQVFGEETYIDRATGEVYSRYLLSSDGNGKGYMAFIGECSPGGTKF